MQTYLIIINHFFKHLLLFKRLYLVIILASKVILPKTLTRRQKKDPLHCEADLQNKFRDTIVSQTC